MFNCMLILWYIDTRPSNKFVVIEHKVWIVLDKDSQEELGSFACCSLRMYACMHIWAFLHMFILVQYVTCKDNPFTLWD